MNFNKLLDYQDLLLQIEAKENALKELIEHYELEIKDNDYPDMIPYFQGKVDAFKLALRMFEGLGGED